jgi:hypothetical protein
MLLELAVGLNCHLPENELTVPAVVGGLLQAQPVIFRAKGRYVAAPKARPPEATLYRTSQAVSDVILSVLGLYSVKSKNNLIVSIDN